MAKARWRWSISRWPNSAARLAGLEDRVSVAASNGPRSSVISGAPEAVAAVLDGLEKDGVFCRLVKVDVASHSPQMEPLAAELALALDGLTPAPAACRSIRPCWGAAPRARRSTPAIGRATCGEPVLFSTAVGQLAEDGVTVFLELGPHPHPAAFGAADRADRDHDRLRRRDEPEQAAFLTARQPLGSRRPDRLAARDAGGRRNGAAAALPVAARAALGRCGGDATGGRPRVPGRVCGPTKRPGAGFIACYGSRPRHRPATRSRLKAVGRWIVVADDEAMGVGRRRRVRRGRRRLGSRADRPLGGDVADAGARCARSVTASWCWRRMIRRPPSCRFACSSRIWRPLGYRMARRIRVSGSSHAAPSR